MAILGQLIFAVIYTFILSWLCSKGWKSLAWFLVLLPYILILLMIFGLITLSKNNLLMMKQSGVVMYSK
jgi:hypothetical protein